jgi:hypothetical protein
MNAGACPDFAAVTSEPSSTFQPPRQDRPMVFPFTITERAGGGFLALS